MPPPRPFRHILISRTDKIGDLLLSLPVFETLKASFPRARITALVSRYAAEVVLDHPAVNRVELYDPAEGVRSLAARLKKLKPDAFVALYPRPKIAMAAAMAGIRVRVGTAFRWYSFLFNRKVRVHRSACDRHEVEYNLDLARVAGASRILDRIRVPLKREHRRFAARYLRKKGVKPQERVIAVHPGHKRSALNWRAQRYAEAVAAMARWKNVRILLTGSREERPLLARLSGLVSDLPRRQRPLVMAGECNLKELAALYSRCACFLSGSTGTMHLAAAVGTPVVSLFCPIRTATPVRWGPWTKGPAFVLMPQHLVCPECRVGTCSMHDPMDGIRVDEVVRAVRKMARL